MGARGYGRTPLGTTSKGRKWKYEHEFEHRGNGIVAIYSYGPAGEHDALVRESRSVMRSRFGVSQAVSSGGVSGYPQNRPTPDPDGRTAICETQTIFCIDAVAGPNRTRLKCTAPGKADWHVGFIVDASQDYLGDGEMNEYFTGPLEDEETWVEMLKERVSEGLGQGEKADLLEIEVRALSQGRYWFLHDGDPVVQVERTEIRN